MENIVNLLYLLASCLFIVGLKLLSHPKTAVKGNILGAVGMFIAVVTTFSYQGLNYFIILSAIILGSGIGAILSFKIEMTAMPQLVGALNGFGGGASFIVAGAALMQELARNHVITHQVSISTVASGIVGAVTLTGSFVAFGKLQGLISEKSVRYFGDQFVKIILLLASIYFGYLLVIDPARMDYYWYLVILSSLLGIVLVISIGGADMPVVIALLNSYSGIAAAATGFVIANNVLIISGSLVGASGIILSQIMCKAMNRSLLNVLFGGFGQASSNEFSGNDYYTGKTKSTSPEEVAMILEMAQRVVLVPGYGMAVAQAQHAVHDLYKILEEKGVSMEFAIHPVAGRMPGHMNVLLAEADIPYDKMREMDDINNSFDQVDVVIVNGANDVVNPLAKTEPSSPIAGMPILEVEKAKTVIVIKRSLSPGFAGVNNPLFIAENTLMLFADGKKATEEIVNALK